MQNKSLFSYGVKAYVTTGIDDENPNVVNSFSLSQNHPNPFNPTRTIKFRLRVEGMTKLVVCDSLGQEVKVLLNKNMRAGHIQCRLMEMIYRQACIFTN